MKVIGVEVKSGEYQGVNYCNVIIHGVRPIGDSGFGEATQREKVKHAKLCDILGVKVVDDVVIKGKLMGKDLDFAYDRYQNVNYIQEVKAG